MPIDTKPERKDISGAEAMAADDAGGADIINISVDIAGALKGPKPGAKQKPRAKKQAAPAA
jgi:hypothetical protein